MKRAIASTATSPVPPTLSPGEIARCVGLSRRSVLAELRAAGVVDKEGSRYRISRSRLRERKPDYYESVFRWFDEQSTAATDRSRQ